MKLNKNYKFFIWLDDVNPTGFVKYLSGLYPKTRWRDTQNFDIISLSQEYEKWKGYNVEGPFCIMHKRVFTCATLLYILNNLGYSECHMVHINEAVYEFTKNILDT